MISEFRLVFLVDLHSRRRAELAAARGKRRRRRRRGQRRDRNDRQIISQRINAGDVIQDAGIYACNGSMTHTKKHLTGAKDDKICEAAENIVLRLKVSYPEMAAAINWIFYMHLALTSLCFQQNFGFITGIEAVLRLAFSENAANVTSGLGKHSLHIPFVSLLSCCQRIASIADRFGMDPGAMLDNQKIAQMLLGLLKIAEEFNVAVYITNQVVDDPGGDVFISGPKKPAGGHVLAHAATISLMFRKGNGGQRLQGV
ncbi:hypothetical protein NL676_029454 [Syzygium grande]|nr:hypothetical protein NL676_029454 [Syzygium grande]